MNSNSSKVLPRKKPQTIPAAKVNKNLPPMNIFLKGSPSKAEPVPPRKIVVKRENAPAP